MIKHSLFLCGILLVSGSGISLAASTPLKPDTYQVRLRYQIDAFRTERIVQYQEMMKFFASIGFMIDPHPEQDADDPTAERLTGTITAANARKLLGDRHVRSLLLIPKDAKAAADAKAPIRVQLELTAKLGLERQRVFWEQTRSVLEKLGYRDGVAYDHRGYTRLVGSIPVEKLETLLVDVRRQPAGAALPGPFKNQSPLLVTEVFPELPLPKERLVVPEPPAQQEKLAPSLRLLLGKGGEGINYDRLEVLLAFTPQEGDRDWERELQRVSQELFLEGRLGPVVTVKTRRDLILKLAQLPSVAALRLPQAAQLDMPLEGAAPGGNQAVLRSSSLDRLHALGHRGRDVRVAVIDSDFRGWRAQLGGKLPKSTRYVDFTSERNSDVVPDVAPEDGALGHGTRCALAVVLAAPEAELTLIRLDPTAPYQLLAAARYIRGDPVHSYNLDQRRLDLDLARDNLELRRQKLLEERKAVLDEFDQADEALKRRAAYFAEQAKLDQQEKAHAARTQRFLNLYQAYRDLRQVRIVASSLVWNEGYPVDGSSALSRYLDDRPFAGAAWFQSAGDTRGQTWSGSFRDSDGNGVMEYVALEQPRPDQWWKMELNFMNWQATTGKRMEDLPANSRIRLAVQWREPHDRSLYQNGADAYLKPLVNPRLVLLRQLDPTGIKQPVDDLEMIGASTGPALRLQNDIHSAVYEQVLEVNISTAGRYALRIESKQPTGTRPASEPTLPSASQNWELRPRIFVETLGGAGRAVFGDYATDAGNLGLPGEAHRVITVGSTDIAGRRRDYSAGGPPLGMELLAKPEVLAFDGLVVGGAEPTAGTGLATGYAAGLMASTVSAGASTLRLREILPVQPGGVLRVPSYWLQPPRLPR